MTISIECISETHLRLNSILDITEINDPTTEFILQRIVCPARGGSQFILLGSRSVLRAGFLLLRTNTLWHRERSGIWFSIGISRMDGSLRANIWLSSCSFPTD